uniref:Secreted protein n=1 Tax=Bursaphelenchus xylophilus TaxID=6326 RepID=A0A1I7S6D4_BURXY
MAPTVTVAISKAMSSATSRNIATVRAGHVAWNHMSAKWRVFVTVDLGVSAAIFIYINIFLCGVELRMTWIQGQGKANDQKKDEEDSHFQTLHTMLSIKGLLLFRNFRLFQTSRRIAVLARRLPKKTRSFTQSQDRIYPLRSHLRTIVQFIRSQPSFVAGFLESALAAVPLGDLAKLTGS